MTANVQQEDVCQPDAQAHDRLLIATATQIAQQTGDVAGALIMFSHYAMCQKQPYAARGD